MLGRFPLIFAPFHAALFPRLAFPLRRQCRALASDVDLVLAGLGTLFAGHYWLGWLDGSDPWSWLIVNLGLLIQVTGLSIARVDGPS